MSRARRHERQKSNPGKVSSGARKSRIRSSNVSPTTRLRKSAQRGNPHQQSNRSTTTRSNLLHIASDLRRAEARGEKLPFSQAARNRGVDPRSRHYHVTDLFYKDSSGRIRARTTDSYTQTFSIPTTRPDRFDSIIARGNEERSLVGRWLNAIHAAGKGDFVLINEFPKNIFIDGRRLPTGNFEIQKILEALEQGETALEQQYFSGGAR
jgi:hypothetical protein